MINNAFSLNDPLTVTCVSTSYIEERSKTELQHEESYQCLCTVTIRERHQLTISLKVGRKATAFVKELTFNDRREAA